MKESSSPANPSSAKQELLSDLTWEQLNLKREIVKAIHMKGFETPSKIQAQTLPVILGSDRNCIAQSKNGSGKTAAFTIAALSKVDESVPFVQAIIISPARELAQQNLDALKELGKYTNVKSALACPPLREPEQKCHILSGTPGKLEDWIRRRYIDVSRVRLVILDEADTMLESDESLGSTVAGILAKLPSTQRLLFSATFPKRVRAFAGAIAPHAERFTIAKAELNVASLHQLWTACHSSDLPVKNEAVRNVLSFLDAGQAVVFCNTVRGAQSLAVFLKESGFSVTLLVGKGATPEERDVRMNEFRDKTTTVLVTTDVLARGIDVPAVNLVVNYDMPVMYENGVNTGKAATDTYLHRVGRAGRMGRQGYSLSFITCDEEKQLLEQITQEYSLPINEIPEDLVELHELLTKLKEQ